MNNPLSAREDMPLGLGMAFAQNLAAMEHFSALPQAQQQAVIASARQVTSKKQMQALVAGLADKTATARDNPGIG